MREDRLPSVALTFVITSSQGVFQRTSLLVVNDTYFRIENHEIHDVLASDLV